MQNLNERPVCHRAEDLVTYLYGEASTPEADDFASHVEQCDACRAEFAMFRQVHESIVQWRDEALGTAPVSEVPSPLISGTLAADQFVRHQRKLSALAAMREFFSVSPLWLRGVTALASVLLCVLAVLAVSRLWQKQAPVATGQGEQRVYTAAEFREAVAKEVAKQKGEEKNISGSYQPPRKSPVTSLRKPTSVRNELASRLSNRSHMKGMTRQEWEQLAADLGLIPGKENEELPFSFTDEPEL